MLGPWNAAALPEIMAGALQESKRGALGDGGQTGERQASSRVASPERGEVGWQKSDRGLGSANDLLQWLEARCCGRDD